ncbi:MAG: ASCH domain-containing protein [Opitutaceae bacterium]|nr:ASCH domain-containing protein [Opitutaceae bacterium]
MNKLSKDLLDLPILSIRQPWASFILYWGKDVENRSWSTSYRGRFLIHAAKTHTREEARVALEFGRMAWETNGERHNAHPPELGTTPRGGIVGVASLTDCVDSSDSPWFMGKYGFVLTDVQALPFVPCRGALGFFRLPAEMVQRLAA